MIKELSELLQFTKSKLPLRLVVAAADDIHTLEAIKKALEYELITPILVGNSIKIRESLKAVDLDSKLVEIIHIPDEPDYARGAVDIIKRGHGDLLMKGYITTKSFLKAIVDKKEGIKNQDIMYHIAFMKVPSYHKLLIVSDVAMNIKPGISEKKAMINGISNIFGKLGYDKPKIAILCPTEQVNPKIESTLHAQELVRMNQSGEIAGCIVEGPLALDNAISLKSAKHKRIQGQVAGDADVIICPNIDTGNALYKSLIYMAGAESASIVAGAKVPVILTSRSDDTLTKFYSIVLATILK